MAESMKQARQRLDWAIARCDNVAEEALAEKAHLLLVRETVHVEIEGEPDPDADALTVVFTTYHTAPA